MICSWFRWGEALLLSAALVQGADLSPTISTNDQRTVLLAVGHPGADEYAMEFNAWAEKWRKAAELAKAKWIEIGLPATSGEEASGSKELATTEPARDKLKKALEEEPKEGGELWVVLIGHGTFNGKEAKFNLRGPDVTAAEMAEWLRLFQRPVAIIDCASASAPFINALSHSNHVVISTTRSGYEQNYARFGKYLSEDIGDAKADLDKDGQTSLLEAFIIASKQAAEFYKNEGRLATEHALLDDNGDGYGTPADWFRGVRATKKPTQGNSVDGLRAHQLHLVRSEQEQKLTPEQRAKRDELELSILKLRDDKKQLPEDEYYGRLETLLLKIASLYGVSTDSSKPEASAAK